MNESAGFQCNICGRNNDTSPRPEDREVPGCTGCGSTVRTRSVMHVLSQELFGVTMPVCDFPFLRGIRGIGTSDSHDYASLLAGRFDYRNTWYHRDPKFDITDISRSDEGQYDFLITSEVLEHVAPPVERVFENIFRLLKPDGILVMTVPFVQADATAEHFPNLHDYSIAQLSDRLVLVNRTREGAIEIHEDLVFHGGPGSTLELRLFSEQHLRECILQGGFTELRFYPEPSPEWGIVHAGPWSLPLAARKAPFSMKKNCVADWALQWRDALRRIRTLGEEFASRQAGLQQELIERTEWAQRLDREVAELQTDLGARTEWARSLERDVTERTDWARRLEAEVGERDNMIRALQAEADGLREDRGRAAAEAARLRGSLLIRGLRKLGF